jgi:hypothetical protein
MSDNKVNNSSLGWIIVGAFVLGFLLFLSSCENSFSYILWGKQPSKSIKYEIYSILSLAFIGWGVFMLFMVYSAKKKSGDLSSDNPIDIFFEILDLKIKTNLVDKKNEILHSHNVKQAVQKCVVSICVAFNISS